MSKENPYERPYHPLLVVISGVSGVGKDTVARLLQKRQDSFYFVVTATTRPRRPGEVHGRDYLFISPAEFQQMIDNDDLFEYAQVYNDLKGIPKQQVRDALASGKDVIMRLDVQGAATVRQLVPQAVLIFLIAESEEAMIARLQRRRSETPESLAVRLTAARQELERIGEFDYCVLNAEGRQDAAVDQILSIVEAEHCRVGRPPIHL